MATIPKLIPISELRQDAAGVLKVLQGSEPPIVVTQRGRAAAILLSIDAYERSERERELLRLLAVGEKEISYGKGFSLDSVLKEADKILKGDRS